MSTNNQEPPALRTRRRGALPTPSQEEEDVPGPIDGPGGASTGDAPQSSGPGGNGQTSVLPTDIPLPPPSPMLEPSINEEGNQNPNTINAQTPDPNNDDENYNEPSGSDLPSDNGQPNNAAGDNGPTSTTPAPPLLPPAATTAELIQLCTLEVLERLAATTARASTTPPAPTTYSPSPSRVLEPETITRDRVKVANAPEPFSGNRSKLEYFIANNRIYFDTYPNSFISDKEKITYMLTNIRGPVWASLQPYVNQEPRPFILQDLSAFISHLRRHWGTSDEKGNAKRSLRMLRQTGTADSFFVEFQRLTSILGWDSDSEALIDQAVEKMSEELQDELARAHFEPTTFSELMDWATTLDNRLRARAADKGSSVRKVKGESSSSYSASRSNRPVKPSAEYGNQSARTNATPSAASGSQSSQPREPLSADEKARRLKEGLCAYCGLPDHQVANCGLLRIKNERLAAAGKIPGRQA
ncbi:hypothetical protein I350_07855 [Cryptococcus amylolentus CBS 6273]|uniref:Ty3 transposon capsid-like protein domain-containing protein n=1 Tax=Cryptococcus amylolentus CBS 6273 TaxID=1296118 RepID=A0A1E3JBI1_9TREE|nr:hypothetical protein I350_07855 [Cryptococcus amylolentus CBS 6273]